MKSSRYTFFTSLLCASGLSGGLCFCIITSFSVPADRLLLACACVLAALFFSALLLLPKSWIWLLAVAALAGGGLYMLRAQLIESASALVSAVTQQYSEAIPGIQVIQLTDAADADADQGGGEAHRAVRGEGARRPGSLHRRGGDARRGVPPRGAEPRRCRLRG